MRADDAAFAHVFGELRTYELIKKSARRTRGAIGKKIFAALMAQHHGHEDNDESAPVVHSTIINWDDPAKKHVARWILRPNATPAPAPQPPMANILVLFAEKGTFIYIPNALKVHVLRVPGTTHDEIIHKLDQTFERFAYIAWSTDIPIPRHIQRPAVVETDDKQTIRKQHAELAIARKIIGQLICTNPATPHAPPTNHGLNAPSTGTNTFHKYYREIRGFTYEFSDDFRPDTVPATHWESNLLFKYMVKNKSDPACIFPLIRRIVSCTPRYGNNCDYGVVFEHPVSKASVTLDMCKAFATVCSEYRATVFAFQLSIQ